MNDITLSIKDLAYHLPEQIIYNDYFGEEEKRNKSKMFAGTNERRHFKEEELASDHMEICAQQIIERNNLDPEQDIDMIVTNVSYPDEPFTGSGIVLAKKIGAKVPHVFDLHNTGCVAFINMLDMVKAYMKSYGIKSALVCASQTAGGRIFGKEDTRQLAQSCVPGDGTAVAYVTNDSENKVSHITLNNNPENGEDMTLYYEDDKKWWQGNRSSGSIEFPESKTAAIFMRGNRLVPRAIKDVCKQAEMKTSEIDYLITNQPNPIFLRNWRESIQLPKERHLDTFEKYANLFGAGIPITLGEHMEKGTFQKGDTICLAGFAHAGDFSSAAIVKWG
ncbi:3-oxoacyl-ACP synthase III family protein [Aureibacter tunicatorum]|uniref:3-oxoacyl-[acyl-carrier-protein] synthase-3 n=1 Tax=Aureibacter tunicatorum TaxID=866807 RepID=A0AAE3XLZ2_9BACT|nr:3-oxoacyl-ACP synthase III family protein [Aureibacter tunicatorum]MDR6238867.1 3-oxoacyl-[acyl-carrier-protein] synthase-3 [Aureibacter tunicatorum]BDD05206.1 3-oxoacyl-ACP synthase [Aureibacter tunicatorum]